MIQKDIKVYAIIAKTLSQAASYDAWCRSASIQSLFYAKQLLPFQAKHSLLPHNSVMPAYVSMVPNVSVPDISLFKLLQKK